MVSKHVSLLATPGDLTASAAVHSVATGARSVSDLAASALAQVADKDPAIGAFRIVDELAVHCRAAQLDGGPAVPLRGVMVGIKDVIDTADLPTGYGSPLFLQHRPTADAHVVARVRATGGIVLGKTESTEFAMYEPTRTKNPADLTRTPGGSSSGSAAAVAAGMVPVALGTQTAGSVVRPGAYCGVYGFKPAKGWTSTEGIWRLSEVLDTVGLFSRSAADLLLLYEALRDGTGTVGSADPSVRRSRAGRPPRVGVLAASEWGEVDGDVIGALEHVASELSRQGCRVSEMAMPPAWRDLPATHLTVMAVEVARNLHAALGPQVELVSESARSIVQMGDQRAPDYEAAMAATHQAASVLQPLAGEVDLILTPSALGVAPEGHAYTGDPVMCRAWTLLGVPASNVPWYRRADGLPVGVQLVSPVRDDDAFLAYLVAMEAAIGNQSTGVTNAVEDEPPLGEPASSEPVLGKPVLGKRFLGEKE